MKCGVEKICNCDGILPDNRLVLQRGVGKDNGNTEIQRRPEKWYNLAMLSLLFRSLWYDRWINTAVVFGVLCATAVLTGALLVGDSMRGSLKALTLDRLGNIDTILFAPHFIVAPHFIEYPRKNTTHPGFPESERAILLPAAVELNGKVSGIQLLARALTRLIQLT